MRGKRASFLIDSVLREFHGQETEAEIFTKRRQRRQTGNASLQARHGEIGQGRPWWQGQKPQTSDCHRPFQGSEEGQEGAAEEEVAISAMMLLRGIILCLLGALR
jgi:hypothetical protein